LSDIWKSWSIR